MIEVVVRLGLALLLSLGLAVLLAWGWDSSDRAALGTQAVANATSTPAAHGMAGSSRESER